MIETFARHGLFNIDIKAAGDLHVDQHHLVEDTGIVLGQAFNKALGGKKGIRRVGSCLYPMDETLVRAAVDLSGRPFLYFGGGLSGVPLVSAGSDGRAATFQTDTTADFWQGFAASAACSLHIDILRGRSDHHKIEAIFKAAARALRKACEIDPRASDAIPSTKGCLHPPVYLA
jgi:imidazoleglycerol-phosphate dehydratase